MIPTRTRNEFYGIEEMSLAILPTAAPSASAVDRLLLCFSYRNRFTKPSQFSTRTDPLLSNLLTIPRTGAEINDSGARFVRLCGNPKKKLPGGAELEASRHKIRFPGPDSTLRSPSRQKSIGPGERRDKNGRSEPAGQNRKPRQRLPRLLSDHSPARQRRRQAAINPLDVRP